MAVRVCPLCGSDLVTWVGEPFVHNGFDVTLTLRGCPKRRDRGAGEREGFRWMDHYADAIKKVTKARFS